MPILPGDVVLVWKQAHTQLSRAFDRSLTHTADLWLTRCKNDLAQLWQQDGFWIVSEVQMTKHGRVLHIVAAAGIYNDLLNEVESWGKSQGCKQVLMSGRKGWMRRLGKDYKLDSVTLLKDI